MRVLIRALAIARLTTLIVDDEITAPIREPIQQWAAVATVDSPRNMVGYLVGCRRCVSVWAALAVLIADRFRWSRWLVDILAGSQAALFVMKEEYR